MRCVTLEELKFRAISAPRCSAIECISGATDSSFLLTYIVQPANIGWSSLPVPLDAGGWFSRVGFTPLLASWGVYLTSSTN